MMTLSILLYLLGWLCLAVGIALYNNRPKHYDLPSCDVVKLMEMAGRKTKVTG